MAYLDPNDLPTGLLEIQPLTDDKRIVVYFIPRKFPGIEATFVPDKVTHYDQLPPELLARKVKLIELNYLEKIVKIYPVNTANWEPNLKPKYHPIDTISIEFKLIESCILEETPNHSLNKTEIIELLYCLPYGLAHDFNYGLGFFKSENKIVTFLQNNTECTEICLTEGSDVRIDGAKFIVGLDLFESVARESKNIKSRGEAAYRRVQKAFIHNSFAEPLRLQKVEYTLGRKYDSQLMTKAAAGSEALSDNDLHKIGKLVASQSKDMANRTPEQFRLLKKDIELVALEKLIDIYASLLNSKAKESDWQQFFENNTFALQMVFGTPLVMVQPSATVGGTGFNSRGTKIADGLLSNPLTDNVALVELKLPNTRLLGKHYRDGVYSPSTDLSGAVSQTLDQIQKLGKNFSALKDDSDTPHLKSYAIHAYLIIGQIPKEKEQKKSFEQFRNNSKSVTIVTYDEILEKLRILLQLLKEDCHPEGGGY